MLIGILAIDTKGNIGNNGDLLIKLKGDLSRFKELTSGNSIIMGRKTFESIGKPLPNRQNIVITRNKKEFLEKYSQYKDQLLIYDRINRNHLEKLAKYEDLYIIGGTQIYNEILPFCDKIELTEIKKIFEVVIVK